MRLLPLIWKTLGLGHLSLGNLIVAFFFLIRFCYRRADKNIISPLAK